MGIFSKYITKTVKEAANKRGKLSRVERAAFKKQINKAVKELEITSTEAEKGIRAEVKSPKPPAKKTGEYKPKKKNPSTKKDKGSNVGLTPEERREKARLMRQSKKEINLRKTGKDIDDMPKDAPGGRQKILIDVPGTKGRRQREVADPQNRLKGSQKFSAEEMKNWTPAEIEEYNRVGFGGSGRAMKDQMLGSGKRSGKGVGDMDTQSKKYGGKIKRNMGGPVRGVGKAMRGFGKANYSNKMY